MNELLVDTHRAERFREENGSITCIYVRAKGPDGEWGSFDIALLEKESLLVWLRRCGGSNPWAEACVLILLGHEPPADGPCVVMEERYAAARSHIEREQAQKEG